tara:strand:- start:2836 stop:3369 length:534 start_codon:yes stop_codon:yes gene_type:complete
LKLAYLFSFLLINLLSSNLFAQTIGVVNIQFLIDNNKIYIEKLKEIENSQNEYLNEFKIKEDELEYLLNDIEKSKLILSENEINFKIDDYNKKLKNFTILIEEFNTHYQNQIVNIREIVFKEIIVLLEKYATLNNIDLILDSTSYLIASNSLDITDIINKDLNKIKLVLDYKSFEKN